MRSESVSKIRDYRKLTAERLYYLLKEKILIDMRKVKRFRIWQILVLKRKIATFMRRVKETNRRFLQRSLKVIIEVLKKPLLYSFRQMQICDSRAPVPLSVYPNLSACAILNIYLKLMTQSASSCLLPVSFKPSHLVLKAFSLWKSRTYPSSPFLQRKLVLTLSVMSIVLHHRWENINHAYQKLSRMRERIETIPLCKSIRKLVNKKVLWAYRKIYQPRFNRRKIVKKADPKVYRENVKTSAFLLEMMIMKKKGIDKKQQVFQIAKNFNLWKSLSLENQIPKFIMKRQSKGWGCKILIIALVGVINKVRRCCFSDIRGKKGNAKKKIFNIDKCLIDNQAMILVKLEEQHHNKIRELRRVKRLEKLNKCKIWFWKGVMNWMNRWKSILYQPDDQEKLFEYLRYLESQAEFGQDSGVDINGVRAIIERRSTEITNKLMDSDSGINFKSL